MEDDEEEEDDDNIPGFAEYGAFDETAMGEAEKEVEAKDKPTDDLGQCWYFLTLTEKSASARKYRCSTSPSSIQGIVFFMGNGGVTVF